MKQLIKKILRETVDLRNSKVFRKSLNDLKIQLNDYLSTYEWFDKLEIDVDEVGYVDIGGRVKDDTKELTFSIYTNIVGYVNLNEIIDHTLRDALYTEIDFLCDMYFPPDPNWLPVIFYGRIITGDGRKFLLA